MVNGFRDEYRWLSNFWSVPVIYDGHLFTSVEHGYQAMKCKHYDDFIEIKNCQTPGQAKKLARQKVMRDDWETVKKDVMFYLLSQKFNNPEMRLKLIQTGDQELIEDNNWNDVFWGVCRGKGENILGKMLMTIRAQLQNNS